MLEFDESRLPVDDVFVHLQTHLCYSHLLVDPDKSDGGHLKDYFKPNKTM